MDSAVGGWTVKLHVVKRHGGKDSITQSFDLRVKPSDSCSSLVDQIEVLLLKLGFPDVALLFPLDPRKLAEGARNEEPNCRWPYALRLVDENYFGFPEPRDDFEPPDAYTTPLSTFLRDGAVLAAEERRAHH